MDNNSFLVMTVDSYAEGLTVGRSLSSQLEPGSLMLNEEIPLSPATLRRRYAFRSDNPHWELERTLMRLSTQGLLQKTMVVFGVNADPFVPFEGRFDCSIKFLSLFERYTPGKLIVQTRSPLIVLALPVLRRLGEKVVVTIPVESSNEDVVSKYMPELPRLNERIRASLALRRMGIKVAAQVFPLLPYGDWKDDAGTFAKFLADQFDTVTTKALNDGSSAAKRILKKSGCAERLAQERMFKWLRSDADIPLLNALDSINPGLLATPYNMLPSGQMNIFERRA